jgi:hypothetical protein
MKIVFLGISFFLLMSFSWNTKIEANVDVCAIIDQLITEVNLISTINNKTPFIEKLENAKAGAKTGNWTVATGKLNAFITSVDGANLTSIKSNQKVNLRTKAGTALKAIKDNTASCGS